VLHRLPNIVRRALTGLAAATIAASALVAAGAAPAAAEVRSICWPLLDPLVAPHTNTFGAARSGGRSHEGNDLMGRKMDRVVSAVDGTIVDLRWRGTGHSDHGLRILGDDGYYYAYLHMNNDTPGTDDGQAGWGDIFAAGIGLGARVVAGQMLGYMGDSGNAESAGPHLHFEIRTPAPRVWDSVAIDPFPSLQAATFCPVVSPTRDFVALGGILRGDTDATTGDAGLVEVFGRGIDDGLYSRTFDGTTYSGWVLVGGILRSGPGVVASPDGRLDVFVRGRDDQLWASTRLHGVWQGWYPLGGIITADPDATVTADGRIVVMARGADQGLWFRELGAAGWSGWQNAAGGTPSGPTVTATADGFSVYIRGLDNQLWRRDASAQGLGGWTPLGGIITADPDANLTAAGVTIVVRGVDHRIWELAGGAWSLVSANAVGGSPTTTDTAAGGRQVFVNGPDRALYHNTWDGSGW